MTELLEKSARATNPTLKKIPQVQVRNRVEVVLNTLRLTRDPLVYMRNLHARYGEIVKTRTLPVDYTFIFNAEFTRQVLSNTNLYHNGSMEDYGTKITEDSPLYNLSSALNTVNGDLHKFQRRLMMPAFHRKRVETYRDQMVALTEQKLAEWRPGETRDMLREMKQLTMSVAIETLLGLEAGPQSEKARRVVEHWLKVGSNPLALVFPYDVPGSPFRTLNRTAGQVEKIVRELIESKRASGQDKGDVLSMLLQARDEDGTMLADRDLISQTMALFVAGHETTATALSWTLFLLAQHPRVMADLLDELDGQLHGQAPTLEQLNELPFLNYVIDESMRILSPFVFGMRFAREDTSLGDYFVPKGSVVAFAPAHLHHDPAVYPEPRRFLPRRWETAQPGTYEFLPFSAGPRMCIGATFALMEIRLVLATLLQRFRLTVVPQAKIDRTDLLLCAPRHGLPMQIQSQDRQFVANPVRGDIHKIVLLPN